MEFRILGPLEVHGGRETIEIRGPRQSAVLAALLLEPNRIVPITRLAEAVWDSRPPQTAKEQVQNCISAMRRTLTDAGHRFPIVTRPAGYVLQAGADELDAVRFATNIDAASAAAAAGDLPRAAMLYRRGLEVWRGPALNGIESRIIKAGAVHLNERRMTALEECFDIELELGNHHRLVGELNSLIATYPLHERFRGQAMLALYRSGRTAEALELYQQTRRTFIEELGLEPRAELRQLEQDILVNAPRLDITLPAEAAVLSAPPQQAELNQIPSDLIDFVGRESLLDRVTRELEETRGDRVATWLITGPTGAGKTAFVTHLAHRLLHGFADGCLWADLGGSTAEPAAPSQVLGTFLLSLGVPSHEVPDGLTQRTNLFRVMSASRQLLVILDDVASSGQLAEMLPTGPHCAGLVTGRQLVMLDHTPGQISMPPFTPDESNALFAAVFGQDWPRGEPAAARELAELCLHLPLAVRATAVRLRNKPHVQLSQLAARLRPVHRRLTELGRGTVDLRPRLRAGYDRLSDKAQELFGSLGRSDQSAFPFAVAGTCCPRWFHEELEQLLEELADACLLSVTSLTGGAVRYEFAGLGRYLAAECAAGAAPGPDTFASSEFSCRLTERHCHTLAGCADRSQTR